MEAQILRKENVTAGASPEAGYRSLVEELRCGDENAFSRFYTTSYGVLKRETRKFAKNEYDADDLLQDTYLTILRKLDTLNDPEKLIPWSVTVCRNLCINAYNKKSRENSHTEYRPLVSEEEKEGLDTLPANAYDPEISPEAAADANETKQLLWEILDALPETQRTCIVLWQEEFSTQEIAGKLQLSEGTVKSNIHYAKKKVRESVLRLEKQGMKLYGMAPIPFFLWLFLQYNRVQPGAIVSGGTGSLAAVEGAAVSANLIGTGAAGTAAAGTAAAGTAAAGSAAAGSAASAAGTGAASLAAKAGAGILAKVFIGIAAAAAVTVGAFAVRGSSLHREIGEPVISDTETVSDSDLPVVDFPEKDAHPVVTETAATQKPASGRKPSDTKAAQQPPSEDEGTEESGSEQEDSAHVHEWADTTETVYHSAEYQTVHHDAEYRTEAKTIHHDAVYQTVHHDAEYQEEKVFVEDGTIHMMAACASCGAIWLQSDPGSAVHAADCPNPSNVIFNIEGYGGYYETQMKLVKEAYDEQILAQGAWDETATEQVKVRDAWDEQVLIREAWEETVVTGRRCPVCGAEE